MLTVCTLVKVAPSSSSNKLVTNVLLHPRRSPMSEEEYDKRVIVACALVEELAGAVAVSLARFTPRDYQYHPQQTQK